MNLIIVTIAISKEPNAREPEWVLVAHLKDLCMANAAAGGASDPPCY